MRRSLRAVAGSAGQIAVASVVLLPFAIIYWHSLSGDAAIYLTFIRSFFTLPFSYQPGVVSFGATSPLHVAVHATVFSLVGGSMAMPVSRALNLFFIAAGVAAVNLAIEGGLTTLLVGCLLATLNADLFVTAAQLFETGLAVLLVACVYNAVRRRYLLTAATGCGLLYLVRPELIVSAVAVDALIVCWLWRESRRSSVAAIVLLVVPMLVYHVYMWRWTGAWVPSSVYARAITAVENEAVWPERAAISVRALVQGAGLFYLFGIAAVAWAVASRARRDYAPEFALLAVVAVYVIVPPLGYASRYLLPTAPILIALVLRTGRALAGAVRTWLPALALSYASVAVAPIALVLIVAQAASAYPYRVHPRYDYDTLLLKDLAGEMNAIAAEGDGVLIYEVQAQYFLRARCISLDGIVGGQLLKVLARAESLAEFLDSHRDVRYLVTANAFNTRRLYAGTVFADLYAHDLESVVGDAMTSSTIRFTKIATNPVFSDPKYYREAAAAPFNVARSIRVYGTWNPLWVEHSPLWNSVYRIDR